MKLYCPECETRYEGDKYDVCPEDGSRLFRIDSSSEEGDPLLGAVIDDRFRIEKLLGAGGMGAVYKAIQLSVHREVALKVLRPDMAEREVMLERFFREAKLVSELTHPNIVRLVDFGQDRDRDLLYLVMELVRGRDLSELLDRGRLRINLALEVIYQICGALTEPHKLGIIHRDLKPENIIIMPISDGTLQVKVLDFGIARALEGGTQLTQTGMICGTPSYMSPEQAQNEDLDGRSDLYSLGVILYEMLTGTPPFRGETALQILLNHIQKTAPHLDEVMPGGSIPDEVSELVAELLAKSPEDRPASARVVRDRIDQVKLKLQLRPLRLDAIGGEEDPFDAWVMSPMDPEVVAKRGVSEPQSASDLPAGLGSISTGEHGGVGPQTGELENSQTQVYERGGTDQEYIGVAETLGAGQVESGSRPVARAPGSQAPEERIDSQVARRRAEQRESTDMVTSVSSSAPRGVRREETSEKTAEVGAKSDNSTTKTLIIGVVIIALASCGVTGFLGYLALSHPSGLAGAESSDETPPQDEQAVAVGDESPGLDDESAFSSAGDDVWSALLAARSAQRVAYDTDARGGRAASDDEQDGAHGGAPRRETSPAPEPTAAQPPAREDDEPDEVSEPEVIEEPEEIVEPDETDDPTPETTVTEPSPVVPDPPEADDDDDRDELRDRLEQLRRE